MSRARHDAALREVATGQSRDPFAVLGPHFDARPRHRRSRVPPGGAVDRPADRRDRRPAADDAASTRRAVRDLVEPQVGPGDAPDYRLRITFPGDHVVEIDDPYRYGRVLTDFDLHLFGEGTHHRVFEKLGAHRIRSGSTTGVHFAVWAPNADRVSVIGDFNGWDGRVHPMRLAGAQRGLGDLHSRPAGRREVQVRDPDRATARCCRRAIRSASRSRCRRRRASVVRDISRYAWRDGEWMATARASAAAGSTGRCRSTRCISGRGRACRRRAIGS